MRFRLISLVKRYIAFANNCQEPKGKPENPVIDLCANPSPQVDGNGDHGDDDDNQGTSAG